MGRITATRKVSNTKGLASAGATTSITVPAGGAIVKVHWWLSATATTSFVRLQQDVSGAGSWQTLVAASGATNENARSGYFEGWVDTDLRLSASTPLNYSFSYTIEESL